MGAHNISFFVEIRKILTKYFYLELYALIHLSAFEHIRQLIKLTYSKFRASQVRNQLSRHLGLIQYFVCTCTDWLARVFAFQQFVDNITIMQEF